ncbi:hypothetical protein [Streptomyces sp. NRRL S-813]|uniref:hypothetical protein n=1 Tax=Streptomyces sp. NRRL S-813 TaxID=1463919 RepID=UPI00068E0E63|nr:hypothetical protein [Streptomyces sp. NRRL S-813]
MQHEPADPAIETRAAGRGRRRKRGTRAAEGPAFVDTSGRRSKLLRRIGLLLAVACLAYAVVLGAAFMGWGTSLNPSQLLPFGSGGKGPGGHIGQVGRSGEGPGGIGPQDGAEPQP